MTRQTSKATYKQIRESGALGKMQWVVYDLLYSHGEPLTGTEVNSRLGSYSGHKRLSELERMGVIEEAGKRICTITGRMSLEWATTDVLPQKIEAKEKPSAVIKVYSSGYATVNGVRYEGAGLQQIQGVKKSARGIWPNDRKALQLQLWSGMPGFSLESKDLNTGG